MHVPIFVLFLVPVVIRLQSYPRLAVRRGPSDKPLKLWDIGSLAGPIIGRLCIVRSEARAERHPPVVSVV
jgi:hypothetical protein